MAWYDLSGVWSIINHRISVLDCDNCTMADRALTIASEVCMITIGGCCWFYIIVVL